MAESVSNIKYLRINLIVAILTISIVALGAGGVTHMFAPVSMASAKIDLSYRYLPEYALRTSMRFILAIISSVIIGFIYATLAAKNKRIGALLVSLLDVFQSVPVLGYLSFTVTAFVAIMPNNIFGIELAIIFAIFTAQVWNIIFSIYQSLTTVPQELYEASKIYKSNQWPKQNFRFD